jgi:hypothetical protein
MGFAEEVDELISVFAAWFIPELTPRFLNFRSLASRYWPYSALASCAPPRGTGCADSADTPRQFAKTL